MKTKFTLVPIMAIMILAGALNKAFAQDESNFRYIDAFEPPEEASLWWNPEGSGSTTGHILDVDGDLVTYRVSDTETFNPATESTMSMKLAYMWDADKPMAPGSHLIRQHMPAPNANVEARRFLPEQAIEVFMYGDGSGNKFRFMTRETVNNQLEGSEWHVIDWTGWRRITWRLSEDPVLGWVNGDGEWSGNPIYFDSFQLTWSGQTSAITGAVYFDDLRIVDPFDVEFVVEETEKDAKDEFTISLNGVDYAPGAHLLQLFPGEYTYFVKKDGFITGMGTFVVDDQDLTVEVDLNPGTNPEYAVNFTIMDLDGELIDDAILSIDGVAFAPGLYSFNATPGFYNYLVERAGYYTQSGLFTVMNEPVFRVVELIEDPSIFNTISLSWHVAPTADDPQNRLEHYSVWITKDDGGKVFSPDDYEMVFEETLTADIDAWDFQSRSVNISWHHSKDVRVAFRHHDVTGMDRLAIDNVKIIATRIGDTPASILDEDFEEGVEDPIDPDWLPENWFAVDLDDDGHNWFFGATAENGYMASRSNSARKDALTPDNWLVSEEVTLPVVAFYNVTFAVKDQFDNNVDGAIITFNGQTYEAGQYVFSAPNGSYEYAVAKAGYIGTSGTVNVYGGGQIVTVTIQQMLNAVTFNVNMQQKPGGFTPGDGHTIYITGSFPEIDWAEPGTLPDLQLLSATDNVFIFTKTLMLPTGTFAYKYFDGPSWGDGEWQGGTDRQVTVTGDMTVNDWFGHEGEPSNVDEIEGLEIKVFPNPTRSNINISSDNSINQVRLVDMLGQVVYSADVRGQNHQISVNSLGNGIYFLQIFTNNGFVTRKVQVQK